jgi:transcriptional regulator with XRE-family HTH domain
MMGARLNSKQLQFEMARRGLTGSELARRAHLSPGTVSQAVNGRRVAPRTMSKLTIALLAVDPIRGLDELLHGAPGRTR